MYSTYNLWRKEFEFWDHGQEKHAAWLAVILHNHAINTGYTGDDKKSRRAVIITA